MTKPRMTLEEHQKLGAELKTIRSRVSTMVVDLSAEYPNTGKVVRRVEALGRAVENLRCELDNRVCTENPHRSDKNAEREILGCYY